MRLSSILMVLSAVTLLASGNAANAGQGAKVSKMMHADVDLLVEGLSDGETKRFLRSHESDDNEERLGGANMFNIEKLDDALNNANYANTLYGRWKRHGFDVDKVTKRFSKEGYQLDANAKSLFKGYETYLKTNSALQSDAALFVKANVYKAFDDVTYADDLYKMWRQNGLTSDDVIVEFKQKGVNMDKTFFEVYQGYFKWLNTHHPLEKTVRTTPEEFLFSASRIQRARKDEAFAEKLFAKWKASGLDEGPVYKKLKTMGLAKDKSLVKLYEDYVKWLDIYHPLSAKANRS